jgi:DNA-binding transcriptional ArsR family regulator
MMMIMAQDVFKALAAPNRRRILDELVERQEGLTLLEICTRLAAKHGLGLSRQAVSQHLAALESAGLVQSRRHGRYKFHDLNIGSLNRLDSVRQEGTRRLYTIELAPLQEVDRWLEGFRRFWTQPLDALAAELARRASTCSSRQPTTTHQPSDGGDGND